MVAVAPIEGGDTQLVDHDNVFGAPYEETKFVDYKHLAPPKCVVVQKEKVCIIIVTNAYIICIAKDLV